MGYNWTKRLKVVFLAKQLPVFRLKIGRRSGEYSPPLFADKVYKVVF